MNQFSDKNIINQTVMCQTHQEQEILFLCTDFNQPYPYMCAFCIDEIEIPTKNLISIEKIIKKNENTILNNWPILNDKQLVEQLKESTQARQNTSLEEEITSFFKSFRSKLLEKIDLLEQQFFEVSERINNLKIQALQKYNNYSITNSFADIIQSDLSVEEKNLQTKDLIQITVNQQLEIKIDITKSIKEIKDQNCIDFENMTKQQDSLLDRLTSLSNFLQISYKYDNHIQDNDALSINSSEQIKQKNELFSNNKFNIFNQPQEELNKQQDKENDQNLFCQSKNTLLLFQPKDISNYKKTMLQQYKEVKGLFDNTSSNNQQVNFPDILKDNNLFGKPQQNLKNQQNQQNQPSQQNQQNLFNQPNQQSQQSQQNQQQYQQNQLNSFHKINEQNHPWRNPTARKNNNQEQKKEIYVLKEKK